MHKYFQGAIHTVIALAVAAYPNSSNIQPLYNNRVSEVHGSIPSTARASLNLVCQTLWLSVVKVVCIGFYLFRNSDREIFRQIEV